MTSDLRDRVDRIVRARYPGYAFVLLHGSSLRGAARADSDIDLIVVYAEETAPYRQSFVDAGKIFDVFVYDAQSLHYLLHAGRQSQQTVIIDIVCTSITLPTETEVSDYLRRTAQRLKLAPLPQQLLPRCGLLPFRVAMTNLLRDLRAATQQREVTSLAIELFMSVSTSVLRSRGIGGHTRKHWRRALAAEAPDLLQDLEAAFELAVRTNDATALALVGDRVLAQHGGPLVSDYTIPLGEMRRLPLRL